MMSNGPCSSRLSFQSGSPLDDGRLDFLGSLEDEDVREALPLQPRRDRRNCDLCWRITCGPKSRSSRPRFRSWQTFSGRLNTMATGRQWYSRASWTSGLRASGWTFVASTTVELPQGQPLAGDEVQNLERLVGHRLVVLVVADHPPAGIGRKHLGRQEVLAGERALARAAGADEDDEARAWGWRWTSELLTWPQVWLTRRLHSGVLIPLR